MKENLVFIPTYNEEENIAETLDKVLGSVNRSTTEVLVVDDGSPDNTKGVVKSVSGVKLIGAQKNNGNGFVTRKGFDYAIKHGFKNVVKLDADGQHDPMYIKKVLDILDSGMSEFVVCSRYHPLSKRINEPPDDRRIVNIMITEAVNKLTHSNLTDVSSGFCGYSTNLLKKLEVKTKRYGAPLEIIIRARMLGYYVMELPHPVIYRKAVNPIRVDQYIEIFTSLKNELKEVLVF